MNKVFIIAEAGVNHNGDILLAKKLVDKAIEAGADAIKFQSFKTEKLVCKSAGKAEYQKKRTEAEESQFDMLKKLELTAEMLDELIQYCKEKQIQFLSTPFDRESLYELLDRGIETIKVSSGEITNYPFLREIGKTQKKIILSTGMSTLDEIKQAIKVLQCYGSKDITILHCNTEYPTPYGDVNLKAMQTIGGQMDAEIGYSDHTEGIEVAVAAVALGARVIEKHFTLDKNMDGPDHKASLEPNELKEMIQAIRHIEKALGTGIKEPSESEKKNMIVARRSIVASRLIRKGERFTEENLTVKRPGNGITPMRWNEVLGKIAQRDFKEDELIVL